VSTCLRGSPAVAKRGCIGALLFTVLLSFGLRQAAFGANEERFTFETPSGERVEAFRGSFAVPENRAVATSRELTIRYVRLPALGTKTGPPIFYLAGGPGGSGIEAINYRYPIFAAMRAYGDVIALDQRGTGASNVVPSCRSSQTVPLRTVTSDLQFLGMFRSALKECLVFWKRGAADLAGYNTVENAKDLDALRQHLGVDKVVLWGTSYGAHLALAALREMPSGIDRVVLSSVRGLDQTIKLPVRADEYIRRLQEAVDTQPQAKAAYPDIAALMGRVHRKLERTPVLVKLNSGGVTKVDYLLQRKDMQLITASLMSDPAGAARFLQVYLALDRGIDPRIDQIPARLLPDYLADPTRPIQFEAMPIATNLASGVTKQRRLTVHEQIKSSLLGRYLDQSLAYDGIAPSLDLGDGFRSKPVSNIPVLVFAGTLDGRTDIEDQRLSVSGLTNATIVTVRNAGHNLFDQPVELLAAIHAFMAGQHLQSTTITVGLPNLASRFQQVDR
jgi:pimeloyl-ACP methyl ester carboxylesterase